MGMGGKGLQSGRKNQMQLSTRSSLEAQMLPESGPKSGPLEFTGPFRAWPWLQLETIVQKFPLDLPSHWNPQVKSRQVCAKPRIGLIPGFGQN